MEPACISVDIIWWQFPRNDKAACERWSLILSPEERERAEACVDTHVRAGFLAGRYLLRQSLAVRMNLAPQAIAVSISEKGKPYLSDHDTFAFNITNVAGVVALAIGQHCDLVGIDCEAIDSDLEPEAAQAFCTDSVINHIRQLPPGEAARVLLAHWTLKESYLKAIGVGLLEDPRQVEVTWQANRPVITHQGKSDRGWIHVLHDGIDQHLLALAAHSDHGTPVIRICEFHEAETLAG
ncbi:4'-phosphopantetheinyl transferase superfamily protein [Agrobacterium sp. a22-2]|uniref:4'-phosphopantetheinyl transferase family protein n=1 Tax=Agrobacterium sp. a22-2 TaxID=2283840 RepID=UPI0014467036|nr:4'-phosphopantetheinyl transferase superfamily protein [Agrobacterium sp. a22-2]NKN37291.1 4'-phosphopantetheinyl transferase superfamily protein [Agrobacterium sp. a22-2]